MTRFDRAARRCARAKIRSHRSRVASSPMPQSTSVQPSPSSSSHRLMWSSANGSGMRSQCTPGAISKVSPPAGGAALRILEDGFGCHGFLVSRAGPGVRSLLARAARNFRRLSPRSPQHHFRSRRAADRGRTCRTRAEWRSADDRVAVAALRSWAKTSTCCATRCAISPRPRSRRAPRRSTAPTNSPPICGRSSARSACSASRRRKYGGTHDGLPRPHRRHGGNQPRLGLGRPVLRRPLQPVRQPDPPQRQRGAEAEIPARTGVRRACRRARDVRARRRLGRGLHAARAEYRERKIHPQRQQDVDHQRAGRRRAGGLRQDRRERRAARHHRLPHRKGLPGFLHGAEAGQARHARLEHLRAGVPRLRSAGGEHSRRHGPRRERADERPRLRARRARRRAAGHHGRLHGRGHPLRARAQAVRPGRSANSS